MTGQRLLHYQVLNKLGEGGMGVVYKARDTHLDRFVAINVRRLSSSENGTDFVAIVWIRQACVSVSRAPAGQDASPAPGRIHCHSAGYHGRPRREDYPI